MQCRHARHSKYGVVHDCVGIKKLERGQPSDDPPGHVTVVDAQV